ncbi:hypothetical protein [Paenibacillus thermotolerans]|uniref:hypothetical protein n=1 Tax=Paenibacillus thermotolerans TaxID=3027807 RepID=UPI0023680DF5|nr:MULTISPECIES: hypothetical protein [unclassified Paenibacillus]
MVNKNGITDANSANTNDNMTAQAVEGAVDNPHNVMSVNDKLAGIETERSIEANERQKSAE